MNPVVIYKSEYGATKKYAEHIAKSLGCKAISLGEAQNTPLDAYDSIIFGGGVYVGKINGAKFIIKEFNKLKDKKLAVFSVSLSPVKNSQMPQDFINASFPVELRDKIKFFHFRGGMDVNKLSLIHRTMLRAVKKMLEKKPEAERTVSDNEFISVVGGKAEDYFDANAIEPLIEYMLIVRT